METAEDTSVVEGAQGEGRERAVGDEDEFAAEAVVDVEVVWVGVVRPWIGFGAWCL